MTTVGAAGTSPAIATRALAIGSVGLVMLLPVYYLVYLALSKPGTEFDFPPSVIPDPISLVERDRRAAWLDHPAVGVCAEQPAVRRSGDRRLLVDPVDGRLRLRPFALSRPQRAVRASPWPC